MLRTVFIGYDGGLNRAVVDWLARESELCGCVWIPNDARWHRTWQGRRDFLGKRLRKRGLLKTIDEIAYYVFHHATDKNSASTLAAARLVEDFRAAHPARAHSTPEIFAENVNAPEVRAFLAACAPDVILAHCINQYFGRRLRACAPRGFFMWHAGITPEYKGLYSPFWTLYHGDFENFGYTLLRVSDELDAGEVWVQDRIRDVDVRRDNHVLIEHKVMLASLPKVGTFLRELEAGVARPIDRSDAVAGYYSYPGLSDYLVARRRIRSSTTRSSNAPKRAPSAPAS